MQNFFEERRDLLSAIEQPDSGKPLRNSVAADDVQEYFDLYYYYACWAEKKQGETIDTTPDKFMYILSESFGACGLMIPWNYHLSMVAKKIDPANIFGKVIVLKLAEQTYYQCCTLVF